MSQVITQNKSADLVAVLTNQDGTPALALTNTDISVEYRKEGQSSFSSKSLSDTAANITSSNSETFTLADAQTLTVKVDGGGVQTATFNTADFSDITNATAAEIAIVINTDITGLTASDSSGAVLLTSDTAGESSSVEVTGGTANTAIGFSTSEVTGTTPWKEIDSGIYTVEFIASELDTVGSFTFKVTGATIDQFVSISNIVAAGNVETIASLDTCVISGHILDIQGKPISGVSVSAKVLGFPTLLSGIAVSDSLVSSRTDKNGEFFLELARLAEVDITIPSVNYRRQLTVPNSASAILFEIP